MNPTTSSRDLSNASRGYVYLLRSMKDEKFYLGSTTNLKRRLDEHNKGLMVSTKNRRPFKLVYTESFVTAHLARLYESKLKRNPNMYQLFKRRALLCASMPNGGREVVG